MEAGNGYIKIRRVNFSRGNSHISGEEFYSSQFSGEKFCYDFSAMIKS